MQSLCVDPVLPSRWRPNPSPRWSRRTTWLRWRTTRERSACLSIWLSGIVSYNLQYDLWMLTQESRCGETPRQSNLVPDDSLIIRSATQT